MFLHLYHLRVSVGYYCYVAEPLVSSPPPPPLCLVVLVRLLSTRGLRRLTTSRLQERPTSTVTKRGQGVSTAGLRFVPTMGDFILNAIVLAVL